MYSLVSVCLVFHNVVRVTTVTGKEGVEGEPTNEKENINQGRQEEKKKRKAEIRATRFGLSSFLIILFRLRVGG